MSKSDEFLRFLTVSGLQAIANYGSYWIVLHYAPWWAAFLVAVAVGLTLQTLLQIRTTFGQRLTFRRSIPYVIYQIGYLIVFMMLLKWVINAGISAELAPVVVLLVVTPVNFTITRYIVRR